MCFESENGTLLNISKHSKGVSIMELTGNLQIVCPIRGQLKVNKRSKDGLTATEEFYRVEAIKFLISKGYPKENL